MDLTSEFKARTQKIIDYLKEDLKTIRTGRASPSLVENLIIDCYNGQTKLKLMELSTITTDNASSLLISPFDPSTIQDIEKSILKSPLNLSPLVQGSQIIIKIPPLSDEQREKYIKLINEKTEDKKNNVRGVRDDIRKNIKTQFEKKEITEDIKFRLEKDIDTLTTNLMEEINLIREKKEEEIKTI